MDRDWVPLAWAGVAWSLLAGWSYVIGTAWPWAVAAATIAPVACNFTLWRRGKAEWSHALLIGAAVIPALCVIPFSHYEPALGACPKGAPAFKLCDPHRILVFMQCVGAGLTLIITLPAALLLQRIFKDRFSDW